MGRPARNKEIELACKKIADSKNIIIRKYHISDIVCNFEENKKWSQQSFRNWNEVMDFLSEKT